MYLFLKNERRGVVALLLIIFVLQIVLLSWNRFFNREAINENPSPEMVKYQKEIDSLKSIKIINSKPKIYPFNPNFLTDYRAYTLGIPTEAYDKLLMFRKQDKFVNSASEFQQVTGISDSLLKVISPYFKFPDWVNDSKTKPHFDNADDITPKPNSNKVKQPKTDLNLATKEQLMEVYGIGDKLSESIIKYRTKLQGFSYNDQIYEVWGLNQEVANSVLERFVVMQKPQIIQKNINDLTFKELLKVPYMDYELVKKIFNLKNAGGKIYSMETLKKIEGFPVDKFEKINIYLKAE